MRFLRAFRARGTLLFVSHDEAAVLALCERALWLERGVARACGPSKDVCRHYLAAIAETAAEGDEFMRMDGAETSPPASASELRHDPRWAGANPIEIFDFDPDAPWHGHGGAVIEHAGFFRPDGEKLPWAEGGEEVELRIACKAQRRLTQPIVGFILRNKLGLNLFGDNTYLTYRNAPPVVEPNGTFVVTFRFQLPFLPSGDYAATVAITEGSQSDHIHLHWIERAIALRVINSPIKRGQLGVPMAEIRIDLHHRISSE
jgi:lipopolysaccharide transport system ATP-binding protein